MHRPLTLSPVLDNDDSHPLWCPRGGPGWYDSSWDLSCGLDIDEVPDLDAWIGACLGVVSPAAATA